MSRTFALALIVGAAASGASDPPPQAWAFFRQKYDRDGDGRITRAEYGRDDAAFANLDRDRDGVVTESDFAQTITMPPDLAAPFLIVELFGGGEADSVGPEEIARGFAALDRDGDGRVSRANFEARMPGPGASPDMFGTLLGAIDRDRDQALALAELQRYCAERDRDGDGRLSRRERSERGVEPRVGLIPAAEREKAPDFALAPIGGGEVVRLSTFAGRRPVALIFGSFT